MTIMMNDSSLYEECRERIDARLATLVEGREPASLYEPTAHILAGGGKRVRGALVMLACEAVGGDRDGALDAAAAVEILHNFTLVHDDIMDNAATRRGRATVHTKWDVGTAILVGDVMIGLAQQLLVTSPTRECARILDAFARGIVDVCEGQALDRAYETRVDVRPDEYERMIAMKTGRLLEMAAEIGALLGEGSEREIDALRAYARNLGLAFQVQDDLLDLTADEARLGKRIGGDVIEGKRTYLVVQGIAATLEPADRALLDRLLATPGLPAGEIAAVRTLFERSGIIDRARAAVIDYEERATAQLETLLPGPARDALDRFARMLTARES